MERIFKICLPSAAITYTAVVLCVSLCNRLEGYEYQSNGWLLGIFGFIVLTEVLDMLLAKIEFRSYMAYFLTEAVLDYILFMVLVGYVGNSFPFTPGRIAQVTVIFLAIMALVHYYFYRVSKRNADEINDLLRTYEQTKEN